jgi:hypothetical protein
VTSPPIDETDSLGAVLAYIDAEDESGLRLFAARLMQQVLDIQSQIRGAQAGEVRDPKWLARARSAANYRLSAHHRAKTWLTERTRARNRAENEAQRRQAEVRRQERLAAHEARRQDQNNRVAGAAFAFRNALREGQQNGARYSTLAEQKMQELLAVMDGVVAENAAIHTAA